MSQFFFSFSIYDARRLSDAAAVRLELGNAISRRGNWGPHMPPNDHVAEQASRNCRTRAPEDPQGWLGCQGRRSSSAGSGAWTGLSWTISARRSGGCWCGEMGWKIRTRGRIRSPCRNESGGNWGIDRACQGLVSAWIPAVRLFTVAGTIVKIYNYRQGCTAPVIYCLPRYVHCKEKRESQPASGWAWPQRRAAWAANSNRRQTT